MYLSLKRVFLISEKSVLMRRGPRRFGWLSESLGIVKAGAAEKQVVSNQWLSVCPLESTGLCSRLARPLVEEKLKISFVRSGDQDRAAALENRDAAHLPTAEAVAAMP